MPEHVTVCRARCTRDCRHGLPLPAPLSRYPSYLSHPQVRYPACPGYSEYDAAIGASIICPACLDAIGGVCDGSYAEEQAIIRVWSGLIRVRTYICGSATNDPYLAREYAHFPCRWKSQYDNGGKPFRLNSPDDPFPDEVHCSRCDETFPTLENSGNHVITPDLTADLAALRSKLTSSAS